MAVPVAFMMELKINTKGDLIYDSWSRYIEGYWNAMNRISFKNVFKKIILVSDDLKMNQSCPVWPKIRKICWKFIICYSKNLWPIKSPGSGLDPNYRYWYLFQWFQLQATRAGSVDPVNIKQNPDPVHGLNIRYITWLHLFNRKVKLSRIFHDFGWCFALFGSLFFTGFRR